MRFGNLKVGAKIGYGFAIVLLFMVVINAMGMIGIIHIQGNAQDLVQKEWVKVRLGTDALDHARSSLLRLFKVVIEESEYRDSEATVESMKVHLSDFSLALDQLEQMPQNPEGATLAGKVTASAADYLKTVEEAQYYAQMKQTEQAMKYVFADASTALNVLAENLQLLNRFQQKIVDQDSENMDQFASMSLIWMGVMGAVSVLSSIVIAVFVARSITRPLSVAVRVAQTVAEGDLSGRIEIRTRDETGQLLQALQSMNESLAHTIDDVRASAEATTSTSNEIAVGNQDLAMRTEQQASALEEIVASMSELMETVTKNAEAARQGSELARSASDIAAQGSGAVAGLVGTMSAINQSSTKIVEIIGIIDGIAFQTNILALNAAVEAARAGEQGKGFAVVASEVRSLAQRSALAAKDIKELIDDSAHKVTDGNKIVGEAGKMMSGLLDSVNQFTRLIGGIAFASEDQNRGIGQVNLAIEQLNQMTQENAVLVEQAASAAGSLQLQSANLARAVRVFKLAEAALDAPAPINTDTPGKYAASVLLIEQALMCS